MLNTFRGRLLQVGTVAAATLIAVTGAPLQAAASDSRTGNDSSQASARVSAPTERRICARVELTATRIARRVCRTQAEWDRDGGIPSTN